ncbi:MAG: DUF423 domain-containing protein [Crocinitomicaceae bacterium]|nr:DUF423 domain-containing protein [Crocinitomicaceae bacterium]
MNKKMVTTAALLIALSIVLGAFGAHGLKKIATLERVASFETGVRYQFYSAISILILGLNNEKFKFNLKPIYTLLLVGMSCFSISIYLLSLQDFLGVKLSFLGPITPLGGAIMIASWGVFITKLIKQK